MQERGGKMGKAFTLIELLIVVCIIAILAVIAVPNFLEAQTRAKVSRVMADMRTEALALEAYSVDYNVAPLDTPQAISWGSKTNFNYFDIFPSNATYHYWSGKALTAEVTSTISGVHMYAFLNPAGVTWNTNSNPADRALFWWEKCLTTPVGYLSRRVDDLFHNKTTWRSGSANIGTVNFGYGNFLYRNYEHYTRAYLMFNPDPGDNSKANTNDGGGVYGIYIYREAGYKWVLASAGPSNRAHNDQIEANHSAYRPFLGHSRLPSYDATNGTRSWGYILRTNKGIYKIDKTFDGLASNNFGTSTMTGIP